MDRRWWLGFGLLLFVGFAFGQNGTLTGLVRDQSLAVVAKASITATKIETGVVTKTESSSAGYYRIPVPPGTYRVEVSAAGFAIAVADGVVVDIDQVVTADFTLKVGTESQKMTITAEAPLLTTNTAQVTQTITPQEFQTLPVILSDGSRQLDSFIYTSLPGTVQNSSGNSINGGQQGTSSILIDGITIGRFDSNDALSEYSPSTDAVGEFSVVTSSFSAEYGQTGGGVASFSLKSGTNAFHGSVYEYHENPYFNAADFGTSALGLSKSPIRQNDFGATFGGPIRKDRTFFFLAFEGNRRKQFQLGPNRTTLPTQTMLGGDFSSILGTTAVGTDALGRNVYQNEIYDPTSTRNVPAGAVDPVTGLTNNSGADAIMRDPFQSGGVMNVIPQSYFSTAVAPLLKLFPTPPGSGFVNNTPIYTGTCCPQFEENRGTVKIDHVLSDKMKLSASLSWNNRDRFIKGGHAFAPFPGYPLSPMKEQQNGGPQGRIQHTWSPNGTTVNELTAAYNRFPDLNGVNPDAKYSMDVTGTDKSCFSPLNFSAGSNQILNLQKNLGRGCPTNELSESYVYRDAWSHVRGKHSLKLGAQYIHYRYNTKDMSDVGGTFNFYSNSTNLLGFTKQTGNPFASFLLGAVDHGTRGIYTTEPGYRISEFSFYAQDDYKFSPKLTLNLGVRWELPVPKHEIRDRMSGFDPNYPNPGADGFLGALVFLGNCSAPNCNHRSSFQNWDLKLFAPRIGFAYQFNDKLVFRGGYGINYDPNIEFGYGTQSINGFNDEISMNAGTSGTGFQKDPVIYLSALSSHALPAGAQVGVPAFTGQLPNHDPAQVNGGTIDFLPRNSLALPYIQNWSFGFQYEMPYKILLEANYVGSKGTRLIQGDLTQNYNIDQASTKYMPLGDILADDLATDLADPVNGPILAQYGITKLPFPSFESNPTGTTVGIAVQPYPQYGAVISDMPNIGNSTYHSLQTTLKKQASHGLTFIASYTWSKTLTDADSAIYGYAGTFQDIHNMKQEKSIAVFDFTHNFKFTTIYALPFGHGQRWLNATRWDWLVAGWQMTMLQNYHSGDPLAISDVNVSLGLNTPGIRPNFVPGVPLTLHSSGIDPVNGTPYLNPAAFADPPVSPANGFALSVGNVPRFLSSVRGPWWQSETMGIVKDTKLGERFKLQFRADADNVFNRVIRGDPDTSYNDGMFGMITTAGGNGPRVVQFALRLTF